MEPRKLGITQKPVEDMPHLVKEGDNVGMPHQRWPIRRRFRDICYHGCDGVTVSAVWEVVSGEQVPYCGMGELEL